MKVSTRGRYGLRAIIDLAINQDSGAIPLREIADRKKISEQYLEQIFANLRKAGVVKSIRGAHGGYLLNHTPEKITVKDVIDALEGPVAPAECVINKENCDQYQDCITYELWVDVKGKIDNYLESVSIADLIRKHYKSNPQDNNGIEGVIE